ncbi:MAG TPA: RRXRR domain-containing protein, partial [Ktedonobacteraceae bacterium]|nr:RRXRR domain-containing protein [Ktedonobacteraceae bacterium]
MACSFGAGGAVRATRTLERHPNSSLFLSRPNRRDGYIHPYACTRHHEGSSYPGIDLEKGNPLRIPVVDSRGVALMPCTPAKARHLLKNGKARPKRNELGLFYVQLCFEQEPDNQPLV